MDVTLNIIPSRAYTHIVYNEDRDYYSPIKDYLWKTQCHLSFNALYEEQERTAYYVGGVAVVAALVSLLAARRRLLRTREQTVEEGSEYKNHSDSTTAEEK